MPSPFGCIDIRVADQISWFNIIQLRVIWRKLRRKRHVVAKADKVDTASGKNRVIFWCDIEVESFLSYIENECGIKIIGTFETFSPTFPTPEIASVLRISPRDPILKIQTQAVDSNSIPLDYSLLYSNIFEFQVKYFFPR